MAVVLASASCGSNTTNMTCWALTLTPCIPCPSVAVYLPLSVCILVSLCLAPAPAPAPALSLAQAPASPAAPPPALSLALALILTEVHHTSQVAEVRGDIVRPNPAHHAYGPLTLTLTLILRTMPITH